MTRTRTVQLVAAVVMVLCITGAGFLMRPINSQRADLQLDMGLDKASSAVPPHIILQTAALGSFRGLLVDFLWYRVNQLKEEGKYYEINTLSQYITTLQPRFPQVWAFHAWNMSYNISVTTSTPQERWRWINNGIVMLRDQGIVYNPRAVQLYRELSWIFFHKVGQMSDDMHWHYKAELAREWEEILGSNNPNATTAQTLARFRLVADALPTLAQVRAVDEANADLLDALAKAGIKVDIELLRKINRLIIFRISGDARLMMDLDLGKVLQNLNVTPELITILNTPRYHEPLATLVAHLRKRALIDHYHMNPQVMMELMEEFGPIDWRHSAAHGQYWATMGVKAYDERRNPTDSDLLNTYRQKLHSFQDLTRSGRVTYDAVSGAIDLQPDPRFIPAYDKAYDDSIAMAQRTGQKNVELSYGPGHENFLLTAMMYCYLYGDQKEAEKYFLRAKDLYADLPDNKIKRRYDKTIEDIVLTEFFDLRDMTSSARQFVDAMVYNAIRTGLQNYDFNQFNRFIGLARRGYDRYQKDKVVNPLATQDRMSLPPFEDLVVNSYSSYMLNGSVPALYRARVWANTPQAIKLRAYDRLKPELDALSQQEGLAFPQPEDWKPRDIMPGPGSPTPPGQQGEQGGLKVERK